jgi:hypothetical protein
VELYSGSSETPPLSLRHKPEQERSRIHGSENNAPGRDCSRRDDAVRWWSRPRLHGDIRPREAAQDVVDRAAQILGVGADDLEDALESATIEQIDERLEAGEITEEQAAALKDAAERGWYPFPGGGFRGPGGPGGFGGHPMGMDLFDAAAEYLGLSTDELRELMSDGQTLADIAKEGDKSVDGLIDAVVAAQRASLDDAIDEGRITDEQKDQILDGLEDRVEAFVRGDGAAGLRPPGGRFDGFRDGPGW